MYWLQKNHWYDFLLLTVHTILFFGDFRMRFPQDTGIPVITWNVEGKALKDTPQQECTIGHLQNWGNENPNGVVVLQEVRRFQKEIFENGLDKSCVWKPYHKNHKNVWHQPGLMVCVDSNHWETRRSRHRDFASQSSYGFLQMEIIDKHTQKTYNVMNIHLESLYVTSKRVPSFPAGGSISKVLYTMWEKGGFMSIFDLTNKNAQAQEEQLKEIKYVLGQLKDPTLVLGDFNSPPEQWHHRNFRVGYTDAHRETGWGFGTTVQRLGVIRSRIDYMYASKQLFWSAPTTVNRDVHCSDHFPTQSKFDLYQ